MENTKSRREAAFLVIIVFALGILLGGLGTHLWGERVWGHQAAPNSRDEIIGRMTHEVGLTPEQQTQVTAIVDDTRAQWRALYSPLDPKKEEIRQQSRAKLRALMTPEQKVKLEEFFSQLDEQRRKDEGR
jgi:Spy/CpxP family protein refolding chaperone